MTLPGLTALRTYQRAWLPRDLVAAVVLATLLVPQGMAYAELAGLPSITGLYTTVVCLVAFSLVGSSPVLVLGPDSALGPMIAATILPLAAGSEELAIALAGMLALMVGLVTVGTGLARLGFVADLLSSPVRTGYLAGLALTIFVGQLPKLFGFSTDASGLVGEAVAFVQNLDQTNEWALAMGLVSLGIILGLKRFSPRTPGILVAVVVAIVASTLLDLASRGVSVIGVLPQGFPMPAFPSVPAEDLAILFASAVGISLVAIGDTISTSGAFATRGRYEVDTNQELVGIGSANLATGLFSGFPVTTSSSRTAVAFQSGAKTQLTGIAAAALVLAMLLFVPGLVQAMPQPVLAAVVIAASISLLDVAELRRLWHARRSELALAMVSLLGVAFVGVLDLGDQIRTKMYRIAATEIHGHGEEHAQQLIALIAMDAPGSAFLSAELRLLPVLSTHLSFAEIADRFGVSRSTVHTHAMSIYGKLQASGRGEAVERAIELGLLEPFPGLTLTVRTQPDRD